MSPLMDAKSASLLVIWLNLMIVGSLSDRQFVRFPETSDLSAQLMSPTCFDLLVHL